jgi:hypothetical protein
MVSEVLEDTKKLQLFREPFINTKTMGFIILGIVSLVQLGLYSLKKKLDYKISNIVIFVIILFCYYFILPKLFYPEFDKDGINCGLPILGINLGFWIFGTFTTIVTHFLWKYKFEKNKKLENL